MLLPYRLYLYKIVFCKILLREKTTECCLLTCRVESLNETKKTGPQVILVAINMKINTILQYITLCDLCIHLELHGFHKKISLRNIILHIKNGLKWIYTADFPKHSSNDSFIEFFIIFYWVNKIRLLIILFVAKFTHDHCTKTWFSTFEPKRYFYFFEALTLHK